MADNWPEHRFQRGELLCHVHRHAAGVFPCLRVRSECLVGERDKVAGERQNLTQQFAKLAGAREFPRLV